jgi:hypothetical protein
MTGSQKYSPLFLFFFGCSSTMTSAQGQHILPQFWCLGSPKVDEQNYGDEGDCRKSFKMSEAVLVSSSMVLLTYHLLAAEVVVLWG